MNFSHQTAKHLRTVRNRHNDAVRNPMRYTLGTAAKATGKAKSTILRAIKSGTISATKSHDGSYEIEPSELHRVFEPNGAQLASSNDTQPNEEQGATLRIRLEILESERQRERDQMQATIDDLRARLDRSEDRVTALLAAPPKEKRWWSR
jgi:polyhydroxyalkanoate synthesis regulator phasin